MSGSISFSNVHCWILVKAPRKDVVEDFLIEVTTGESKPVNDSRYSFIESLWNSENYWINKKYPEQPTLDLSDGEVWEAFLLSEEMMTNIQGEAKWNMTMPASWVNRINISYKHK